jgi:PDZ domain-containing protein
MTQPDDAHPADKADQPTEGDRAAPMVDAGEPDPPAAGPPAPPESPRRPRRRALRGVIGATALLLVAALVASVFVRMPYYRYSPGSLYPTESLIAVQDRASYPGDGGQVDFTTVSSKKASVLEYYLAGLDEAVDLVPADLVEGGKTPEENRQENLEMMSDSKQTAEVAALRQLGYDVKVHGTGALVKAVPTGPGGRALPATGLLQPNDTIVAVDGQPVQLGEEAVAAIGRHRPGDTVTMRVESFKDDPGHDVTATLVSRCAGMPADAVCTPEDDAKPLLGVTLSNRDTRFDLPVQMQIDTKDVGGPSAGLALTLGIIDVLTPGSLTGGRRVATTGTIDVNGHVGEVGGIKQKTHLIMRQGVSLFLVPAGDEAEEAKGYAAGSDTTVVGVETVGQALDVLREHGGSTDVVGQEAAQRSGTTLPAN